MFCKNCGSEIDPNAAVCPNCGQATGIGANTGVKYCTHCGKELNPNAAFCTNCGCATPAGQAMKNVNGKSKLAAGLLGIFLGSIGVHNFYLGYTGKAVAQLLIALLTCGIGAAVTSIWGLIEGILILTGSINTDGEGNPLAD